MSQRNFPTEDTRGYLPYLRALILLQCDDSVPEAVLFRAGFTVEEIAEMCDKRIATVRKAISRDRERNQQVAQKQKRTK